MYQVGISESGIDDAVEKLVARGYDPLFLKHKHIASLKLYLEEELFNLLLELSLFQKFVTEIFFYVVRHRGKSNREIF